MGLEKLGLGLGKGRVGLGLTLGLASPRGSSTAQEVAGRRARHLGSMRLGIGVEGRVAFRVGVGEETYTPNPRPNRVTGVLALGATNTPLRVLHRLTCGEGRRGATTGPGVGRPRVRGR